MINISAVPDKTLKVGFWDQQKKTTTWTGTTTTKTTNATFQLLMTKFWPNFKWKVSGIKQQQNKSNEKKYLSAISDPILIKLEMITKLQQKLQKQNYNTFNNKKTTIYLS